MAWLWCLAVAVLLPSYALAVSPTGESGELLVTSESNYRAANIADETSSVAYGDGKLFVVWANCADGDANCESAASTSCGVEGSVGGDPYTGLRLRAYDIEAAAWEASLEAIPKTDLVTADSYHEMPAIAAHGGLLHVIDPKRSYALDCNDGAGDEGQSFRYSTLPLATWRTASTYSSPACGSASVDLSTGTSRRSCIVSQDVQAITTSGGDLILAGEGSLWSDTANAGLGRWISKRSSGGTWTGPYQLVRAPANYDGLSGGSCSPSGTNNYFAKGRVLERGGVLYAVWMVQRSFENTPSCTQTTCRHGYDVMAAKSSDFTNWTDLAGGNAFTIGDTAGSGAVIDNTAYRVWTGGLDQTGMHSVDVDANGLLAIVVPKYVSGGSIVCGRPDNQDVNNAPTSSLVLLRQTAGTSFSEVAIDANRTWFNESARPVFDASGRLWVIKEGASNLDASGSPDGLAYMVSEDGGATFPASWTSFSVLDVHGAEGSAPTRLSIYPTEDRRRLTLHYRGSSGELYVKTFFMAERTLAPVAVP